MRQFAIFTFICASICLRSQTLTQVSYEPMPGDTDKVFSFDTTKFAGATPVAITGSACVWDFSMMKVRDTVLMKLPYVAPSSLSMSSQFPGSSFAQKDVGQNLFFKSNTVTPQTEIVGLWSPNGSVKFTNSAIIMKYPMSFPMTFTDTIAGTITSPQGNGTVNGTLQVKADGLGTLLLPRNITFSNVLRVTSTQFLAITAFGFNVGEMQQTSFMYYHSSGKFPLVNILYFHMSVPGLDSVNVTMYVNRKEISVGVEEQAAVSSQISAFPNPFSDGVNILLPESIRGAKVSISDMSGRKAYEGEFDARLNSEGLKPGTYILSVETNSGIARKIIVKRE
jgi:hypothetical protein